MFTVQRFWLIIFFNFYCIMSVTVALAQCSSYHFTEINSAVERVLAEIGGLGKFVAPGQTVLLKPNLLSDRSPDQAITTHPEVVRALIRLVKSHGAIPVVADSAASAIKIESVWEKTGFRALCDEESVQLINLEQSGSRSFEADGMSFSIANPVLDADVIINVPKLKTHVVTVLTNAVKNIYGTLPGYQKMIFHKRYPTPSQLGDFLALLYARIRPALTICDAVVGMEGNGPSGGSPVHLGFLAGSADGVALDTAMCHLLGINMNGVPYFRGLKRAGVGETDWNAIDLAGDAPETLDLHPLHLPVTWFWCLIPKMIVRCIEPYLWIRPFITERCTFCGLCVKSCPVSALSIEKGKPPELNAVLCIGCCCCHEVCSASAIEMHQSCLANFIRRGRLPS